MKNNLQKISLVLSAILFVFLCFVFVSLYKKTNDNNQKAELNGTTWQTETGRREEISSLHHTLEQSADDQTTLNTHFIQSSNVVPFLDTIGQLASLSGAKLEIDSVDIETTSPGLVAGLKVSGSFAEVYKFLTLLENSPYEIDFLSMDLHSLSMAGADSPPLKNIKDSSWEANFEIQLLSFTP